MEEERRCSGAFLALPCLAEEFWLLFISRSVIFCTVRGPPGELSLMVLDFLKGEFCCLGLVDDIAGCVLEEGVTFADPLFAPLPFSAGWGALTACG